MNPLHANDTLAQQIRDCIVELLVERGPGRTLSLSEAAQVLGTRLDCPWQDLMRPVRTMAAALVDGGLVEAIQHETVVDIGEVRGPVRLRLHPLAGQRTNFAAA